jgi:hypothetical protein
MGSPVHAHLLRVLVSTTPGRLKGKPRGSIIAVIAICVGATFKDKRRTLPHSRWNVIESSMTRTTGRI